MTEEVLTLYQQACTIFAEFGEVELDLYLQKQSQFDVWTRSLVKARVGEVYGVRFK